MSKKGYREALCDGHSFAKDNTFAQSDIFQVALSSPTKIRRALYNSEAGANKSQLRSLWRYFQQKVGPLHGNLTEGNSRKAPRSRFLRPLFSCLLTMAKLLSATQNRPGKSDCALKPEHAPICNAQST